MVLILASVFVPVMCPWYGIFSSPTSLIKISYILQLPRSTSSIQHLICIFSSLLRYIKPLIHYMANIVKYPSKPSLPSRLVSKCDKNLERGMFCILIFPLSSWSHFNFATLRTRWLLKSMCILCRMGFRWLQEAKGAILKTALYMQWKWGTSLESRCLRAKLE